MNKLDIIIVSYNARIYLQKCLESIFNFDLPFSFQVLVIDNHSSDDSADMVRKIFPQVRVIENNGNCGFSQANNRGIRNTNGEYILLLNSDTVVSQGALLKLLLFLEENDKAGIVSGRLVYPDYTDQNVCRAFPTPINALFGRRSILTKLFPNNKYSKKYMLSVHRHKKEPFQIDWVSGACLMVKRKVIHNVGLLDEKFFMYWEDADFCMRVKKEGWKIYCVPTAIIVHYEGKSSINQNYRLIIEFNKSVYWFYRKHYIQHALSIMNIIAICGLTSRTIILMAISFLKNKSVFCHENEK